MNRILFEESELENGHVCLPPNDRRSVHVRTVLRAVPGDTVRAGLVQGATGALTVEDSDSNGLHGFFEADDEPSTGGGIGGTLLLAAVRPIVFKRLVKDLSTLGLERILVCRATLTERSYLHASIWDADRLRGRLVEGAEQGGHTRIPEVSVYASVPAAIEALPAGPRFLADQQGKPLFDAPGGTVQHTGSLTSAVGPERGFTGDERSALLAAGFRPVSLGPAILRTEVAAQALPLLVYMHHGRPDAR